MARHPSPAPRLLTTAFAILLLVALSPRTALSQTVTGVLRAEGSLSAIEGAVVALLDGQGAARVATLTDRAGRFRLTAPAPGSYRVRAERVGFRGTISEPLALAPGETVTRDLVAPAVAIELGGIEVSSVARRCVVRPREGVEAATLWDEARKALEAAALTEEQSLVRYRIRRYHRELDRQTLTVRSEQASTSAGVGERPFVSRPAAELAEEGYVRMEGDSRIYYAPDAPVLLSDEFLDTHCFRVEKDEEQPGLIGLAFEPVRDRRIPDIRGVLWLNAKTAELLFVEFDYTRMQLPEPAANGGRVEYERLPSGAWIVRRWWIRMPQLAREAGQPRTFVSGVLEAGGEVTELSTQGVNRVADAAAGTITGVVFDSISGKPLADASVYLSGTSYSAVSDATGAFRIDRVPEGSYSLGFLHPRLEELGILLPPRPVTLARGGEASAELAIPSLTTALALGCARDPRSRESGVLVGLVRDPGTGVPLPDARVTLRYTEGGGVPRQLSVTTDAEGKYQFCAGPVGEVQVRAELMQRQGDRETTRLARGEPTRLDLALSIAPPPSTPGAQRVIGDGAPAIIVGQILDLQTDAPVIGARVRLTDEDRSAVTDQQGEFRLSGTTAGTHIVSIEHRDYSTQMAAVQLVAGTNRADIRLPKRVVALEGIEVTVRPDAPDLARSTTRHAFAGPELRRMNDRGVRMVEMLQARFPIVVRHFYPPTAGVCVEYGRGTGMTTTRNIQPSTGPDCDMLDVYEDGIRVQDPGLYLRNLPLDAIESVELLTAIEAGVRYGARGVGVLLITTRRR